jgi:Domain of unknown function (DUF4249)
MKKTGYLYPLLLAAAFAGPACKKVIDISLHNAAPQIVIVGNVTNFPYQDTVTITQTVDFSAANDFPPVTGATVTITDSTNGVSNVLLEMAPGVYATTDFTGVPLHTYTLRVESGGQVYTASSTMPKAVPLSTGSSRSMR